MDFKTSPLNSIEQTHVQYLGSKQEDRCKKLYQVWTLFFFQDCSWNRTFNLPKGQQLIFFVKKKLNSFCLVSYRHDDTIADMTTPAAMKENSLSTLQYLVSTIMIVRMLGGHHFLPNRCHEKDEGGVTEFFCDK